MPIKSLIGPNGERVALEDAPTYFDEIGLIPMEATAAMLGHEMRARTEHTMLSPSKMDPEKVCRRQVVIENFLPYDLEPMVLWEAWEGTLWHRVFVREGQTLIGDCREISLPRPEDTGKPGVREIENGILAIEVFPGIWMRGTLDRLKDDLESLTDHKTQRTPGTTWTKDSKTGEKVAKLQDYGERNVPQWALQLNIYGFMVEKVFGSFPKHLWIWRTYRGCYDRAAIFRKFPIPRLSKDEVWAKVGTLATTLQSYLREAEEIRVGEEAQGRDPVAALERFIKGIPMDGKDKHMFNGKKCTMFCEVKDLCFKLANVLDW